MKRPRSRWAYAVPVVACAAGLMFGTSSAASQGSDLRPDSSNMAGVVQAANRRVSNQAGQVRTLQQEVTGLTNSKTPGSGQLADLTKRANDISAPTGFEPVTGSVVTVTLDDSHRDPSTLPEGGNLNWMLVHQQDVQTVVNALWRGGATAMMLMDQRVISTSAVRCVGNTLLLQGRVYSPPFKIQAMGDPAKLKQSLDDDPDVSNYRDYVKLVGLGYQVSTDTKVTFPAYTGSTSLRYAKPVSSTPTTKPSS